MSDESTSDEASYEACKDMVNKLEPLVKGVSSAVKKVGPAIGLVRRLTGRMQKVPQPSLDGIEADIPEISGSLEGMLSTLIDCPAIADTEDGMVIAAALDKLNAGEDIPDNMKGDLEKSVRSPMTKKLADIQKNTPAGQLENVQNLFGKKMRDAGVNQGLMDADRLYDCLHMLCRNYASILEKSETAMEIWDDAKDKSMLDAAGEVKDLVSADPSFPTEVVEEYEEKKALALSVKEKIDSFSLPF